MNDQPKEMWIIMKAYDWGSICTAHRVPLVAPPEGPQRFIPVFDTKDQAVAWADVGDEIVKIAPVRPHNQKQIWYNSNADKCSQWRRAK